MAGQLTVKLVEWTNPDAHKIRLRVEALLVIRGKVYVMPVNKKYQYYKIPLEEVTIID